MPDSIFNFWVYSDGSGIDFSHIGITSVPLIALWGFLAVGIVGMAWLLSVLAPWHWSRRNRFQAVMCWIGVLIATSITIWNSLAYRSMKFKAFATDQWLAQAFHITISGFSPTMILVSVAPPFWGLFWAIVQPAIARRSLAEEQESHVLRMERLRQEAEIKRLKAEATGPGAPGATQGSSCHGALGAGADRRGQLLCSAGSSHHSRSSDAFTTSTPSSTG